MGIQPDNRPPAESHHQQPKPTAPPQTKEQGPTTDSQTTPTLPPRPDTTDSDEHLGGTRPSSNRRVELNAAPKQSFFLHHTGMRNLASVFQFGLYLSNSEFNTFQKIVPAHWGWTSNMAAIIVNTKEELGEQPAKLATPLRETLTKLAQEYNESDRAHNTTSKGEQHRLAVRAAKNLLEQESRGELRHYPVSSFDFKAMREANARARYKSVVYSYIDALERNDMHPLTPATLPAKPGVLAQASDYINFLLDQPRQRAEKKAEDREKQQKFEI